MDSKILLYDANGVEIGETYSRRARQLVKQQRAMWADDTHTAIKFMPDAPEKWEQHLPPERPSISVSAPAPDKSSALYAMAEKRIRDRWRLILHTILLIPGYIFVAVVCDVISNGRMSQMGFTTMGFAWGMWTMSYIYRLRNYARASELSLRPGNFEARRRLQLEAEVERLRRMGYE